MLNCSFHKSIGGGDIKCGTNVKDDKNVVVPLLTCKKIIATHLSNCHINSRTVDSEAMLLQLRGGLFFDDTESLTICPNHRQKLGIGWSCGKFCSYCTRKKSMPKGTISKDQVLYLFLKENRCVAIGSGVCVNCRTMLREKMQTEPLESQHQMGLFKSLQQSVLEGNLSISTKPSISCDKSDAETMPAHSDNNQIPHEENEYPLATTFCNDEETLPTQVYYQNNSSQNTQSTDGANSQASEWIPSSTCSSQDSDASPTAIKRKALDKFLEECGVSPIKKILTSSWQESSERTKYDYVRKSKQIFTEVLKVLAPGQENIISEILPFNKQEEAVDMLEVISLAYKQATDWGTQRQILSLIGLLFD